MSLLTSFAIFAVIIFIIFLLIYNATKPVLFGQKGKVETSEFFDWRNEGFYSEIKDQGDCGACYTTAAVYATEGQLFRKTGKLIQLSEQNLLDCSIKFGNSGCDGGSLENSFKYILHNGGINTTAIYPYEGVQGPCRFDENSIGATIQGYETIEAGNQEALTKAIKDIGPIAISIYAPDDFSSYKATDGVYSNPSYSNETPNHGVVVIGYGTENGQDYFTIANSWGPSWGDRGYSKIARNMFTNKSKAIYPIL